MSATVLGNTGIFEQPARYGWSPTRGPFTVRTYKGTGISGKLNIAGLANSLRAQKVEYEVTENAQSAILVATFGNQSDGSVEVPIPVWEQRINRVPEEIYSAPRIFDLNNYFPPQPGNATDTMLDVLKQCAEEKSLTPATDVGMVFEPVPDTAQAKIFIEAFSLIQSGNHSYNVVQPVVVLTETVSSEYDLRVDSTDNAGKILTKAQMISLENAPDNVLDEYALPTGLQAPDPPNFPYGFVYGYLKGKPQKTQVAFNKWQRITEWEAGFWNTLTYDVVT